MAITSAVSFIYDGIPSEKYGVVLCDFDSGSINQKNESHELRTSVRSDTGEHTFLGYDSSEALTFEVIIASENPIDSYTRASINKWLVGRRGFKEFRINNAEYSGVYFRCVFTEQETVYIGGLPYAMKLTAVCDSPYQYEKDAVVTKTISGSGVISLYNRSDIDGYVYPKIWFKMSPAGGNFTIVNASDESRSFEFTSLAGDEEITVDNKSKIITSSTGFYRLGAFNKKWLRLADGMNILNVTGNAQIRLDVPVVRRVGI